MYTVVLCFTSRSYGGYCSDVFMEVKGSVEAVLLAKKARVELQTYELSMQTLLEKSFEVSELGTLSVLDVVYILETFNTPVAITFPKDLVVHLENHFNYGLKKILESPDQPLNLEMKSVAIVTMSFYKMGYQPSLEFRELLMDSVLPVLLVLMDGGESKQVVFEYKRAAHTFLEPLLATRKVLESYSN